MTEKDTTVTKGEEAKDEEFYDDNNENDDYLISKALGNIKLDEGTALGDQEEFLFIKFNLKMKIEPNDEDFKKRITALKEKNNDKSKSIKENIEKIKQEKNGCKKR
jgi:hypothetical protein